MRRLEKINIVFIVLCCCIAIVLCYGLYLSIRLTLPSRIYQSISLKIENTRSELYLSLLPGSYSIVYDNKPRYDVTLIDNNQDCDIITQVYDKEKLLLETSKQVSSLRVNKKMNNIKLIVAPQKTVQENNIFVTIRPTF